MAGRGSRFVQAGFKLPKPLIDVRGEPMIKLVANNISIPGKYIFVVLKEHRDNFDLDRLLPAFVAPNPCEIITTDGITEGAACTVLLAKDLINNDDGLIIANSDQFIEWDSQHFLEETKRDIDGIILTFLATHPKWSYAKIDNAGYIVEVAEKNPISPFATVGIYYFRSGKLFVENAQKMIDNNLRVNNEFYVAPVFQTMIESGSKILPYQVSKMFGLGTPEDLEEFLK